MRLCNYDEAALAGQGTREQQTRLLALLVRTVSWQWQKQATNAAEQLGLTIPQIILLSSLAELGGRSPMRDLVRQTCQAGATLTGIVDRLIDAGLVARDRDEEDRRVVYVALTNAGRATLAAVEARAAANMAQITADFSDDELISFNGYLQRTLSRLGQNDQQVLEQAY